MTSELIFVGLGLSGVDGMTVKAFNALKECDKIYAEFYTSTLIGTEIEDLETVEIPSDMINIWGAAEDVETEVDVTPFLPENMVVYGESPTLTVTVRIEPEVSEE